LPRVFIPKRPEYLALRAATVLALGLSSLLASGCLHRRHKPAPSNAPGAPTKPAPSKPGPAKPGAPSAPSKAPSAPGAPAAPVVQNEEGIASWYGHPFDGRPTSSGEIYNMHDLTAAHRTLPFGTQVRVHDLDNQQEVLVRVNDRGPFVNGRILDLSYAAAKEMGMIGAGTARVRLEILNPTVLNLPGIFAVQVGAFRDRANAERLRDRIAQRFQPVIIQSFDRGDGLYHRVRVGQESSEEAARELARQLQGAGLVTDTFVVRLN
jgi:rare lipoprotein A